MLNHSNPTRTTGILAGLSLAMLLAGCISPELIVPFDTTRAESRRPDIPRNAQIQIVDFRRNVRLDGVDGREILLTPPAMDIARTIVELAADEALSRLGIAESRDAQCEVRVFSITTPATMLHWDVTAKIELLLRVHGQERTVSGLARRRAYIWPSGELITQATADSLRQVAAQSGEAFMQLFARPAAT